MNVLATCFNLLKLFQCVKASVLRLSGQEHKAQDALNNSAHELIGLCASLMIKNIFWIMLDPYINLANRSGGTLPSAFGIGNRFPIAVMDRSSRCSGVVQSHLDKELMSIDAAKLLRSV
eukprot:s953_g19.t1